MKFEIRSTKNGAVLRVEHDYPEGETEEICYQETEHGEIEAFADFLRYLVDHYGPHHWTLLPQAHLHQRQTPGDRHPDFGKDDYKFL